MEWEVTAPLEQQVCEVLREVLAIDHLAVDDHFFRRGGHSLLAMQAAVRIRERIGANIPVSLLFECPTASSLAQQINSCLTAAPAERREPAVAAAPGATPERTQLSSWQRGLWFFDHAMGRCAANLLSDAWRLRGPLDREALRLALDAVVRDHAALSTRFEFVDGEPRQRASVPEPFELPMIDLRGIPPPDLPATLNRLAAEEGDRPIDLGSGRLLRASLIRCADDDHVLLLTVHHIASDEWSQRLLRREVGNRYRAFRNGNPGDEPEPRRRASPGPDSQPTAERIVQLRAYWGAQLARLPTLELPSDRRRMSPWSDRGAEFLFELPDAPRLERLAAENDVTLQMLLLAAYQVLLGRYSGQSDFGVATFVYNRHDASAEAVIGLFVNTVVLRADLSGEPTFRTLLARVRRTSLDAYDHRELPFEMVVADLRPRRQDGPIPFTPVAFQFLPFADVPPHFDGVEATRLPGSSTRVRFDVEMTIRREAGGLRALLGYSTDLFDAATMARFAGHYRTLLAAIAVAPDRPVSELEMLTDVERQEQLLLWSGATNASATCGVVHELFTARAVDAPDATALVFENHRLTYGELNRRSNRLAARLAADGVRPGDVVAIHLNRAPDLIVAMLGVLKAGAAYLPLDPTHPVDRRVFMIKHAEAASLIAEAEAPADLVSAAPRRIVIDDGVGVSAQDERPPAVVTTPESVAYVMYTSGSTGQPKGVTVTHRGVTRLVSGTNYVRFKAGDNVAFASNPAFDAATFEVWGALLNGARLINIDRETLLAPPVLERAIREHGITTMFMTSPLFRLMAGLSPGLFAPLECLVVGGDIVDPDAVRAVQSSGPPRHLLNGYGPTENTTFSTSYEIDATWSGDRSIPIGRPIAGSTCYVLDGRRALLPVGARGELYVGGAGLAAGYVRQPELTAEKFVPHPFAPGARLYRTGDFARWRADGELEFLGRVDRQIKVRGHRVEIEEIEQVLARHDEVSACTVLVDRSEAVDARLVAYVVGREGRSPLEDVLREFLRDRLPAYMVPDVMIVVGSMPLTPNGKVDYAALREMRPGQTSPGEPDSPPRASRTMTALEAAVADAFKEVLGVDGIELHQDFFALGGTSLGALRLAERLRGVVGHIVSTASVFRHSTVSAMAAHLSRRHSAFPSVVERRRGSDRPPLYFPPNLLGNDAVEDAFLDELPSDLPIYALRDPGGPGGGAASMGEVAARLAADVAAFQPEGAICLAGHSFSGLLAYEMARLLTAAQREVKVLAILDTGPDLSSGTVSDRLVRIWRGLENSPRWVAEDLLRSFGRDTPAGLWRSSRRWVRSFGCWLAGQDHVVRSEDLFDVSAWPSSLRAHVDNNLRILSSYRMEPYPGALVLLRARVRPLFHAHSHDLGWTRLVQTVRVIEVPGNHHTMTLEPHLRVVARKLREVLEA